MENKKRPFVRKFLGQILEGRREPQPLFASTEVAKKYMEDRITKRRNDFIEEYKKGYHGSTALTYEPALDWEVYKELNRIHRENVRQIELLHFHSSHPEQREQLLLANIRAYQETIHNLNGHTQEMVESSIGERLNVELSRFSYDLRDGVIYGKNRSEPFIEMIDRGRQTRDTVVEYFDHARHEAEVRQFKKIQEVIGNPDAVPGTTILSFSPPGRKGSVYNHNFYDVFILREARDEFGQKFRYIEARRYASELSIRQSLVKADEIQPGYSLGTGPIDAFLIGTPLVIPQGHELFDKPHEIHQFLQVGEKKAMSYETFQQKILQDSLFSDMVQHYLKTLEEHPEDKKLIHKILNAIMNRADEIVGLRKTIYVKEKAWHNLRRQTAIGPVPLNGHIDAYVNAYGTQKVRQVSTGCGSSGGFGQNGSERLPGNMSPMSSISGEAAEDRSNWFECPSCHNRFKPPVGNVCPLDRGGCGLTKQEFAENGGKVC